MRSPLPDLAVRADSQRATALCLVGLVAGALVLVVGDAAWSIAIGACVLLVVGRVRVHRRRPLARNSRAVS